MGLISALPTKTVPVAADALVGTDSDDQSTKQFLLGDMLLAVAGAYNVKAYGAIGDVRTVTDAVTTNGSPTITSATAAFTAADVGKYVAVRNGTGTSLVVGTILSVESATSITASVNASASGSSKTLELGTDDTTAIQAALTACATARHGTVYFPPGVYLYSASLGFIGGSDSDPIKGAVICGPGATLLHKQGVYLNTGYSAGSQTPNGATIVINFAQDVTIRDLVFQGPGQNNFGCMESVVHITGLGTGNCIERCTVFDHFRGVALDFSGSDKGYILNNQVRTSNAAIQQSSGAGTAVVSGNQIIAPNNSLSGTSEQIYAAGYYTRIVDNYIETFSAAGALGIRSDTGTKRHVIANNTIIGKGSGAIGIKLDTASAVGCVIADNTIETCNVAIAVAGNNHAISGNTMTQAGASSIGIALYVSTNPATVVSVQGNVIKGFAVGVDGNSLVCDQIGVVGNVFDTSVTTKINNTNWTNSKGTGNVGMADF